MLPPSVGVVVAFAEVRARAFGQFGRGRSAGSQEALLGVRRGIAIEHVGYIHRHFWILDRTSEPVKGVKTYIWDPKVPELGSIRGYTGSRRPSPSRRRASGAA
jgi:hypothetical protein